MISTGWTDAISSGSSLPAGNDQRRGGGDQSLQYIPTIPLLIHNPPSPRTRHRNGSGRIQKTFTMFCV